VTIPPRGVQVARHGIVRVWLSRKLAEFVDGVDLRHRQVGEAFDLATAEAQLLIAERDAALDRRTQLSRRSADRAGCDRRRARPRLIGSDR